jgi:4-alpha-glucanotransferase
LKELKHALLSTVSASGWQRVGVSSHHGINVPLSALHSHNSCGIGEFFDLIPLIDWCHQLKLDFIQLLPLNDSGKDPSPYNAISSCALNPIYLSLHALPDLEDLPQLKKKMKDLHQLTDMQHISYTEVLTHKLSWMHAYFDEVGERLLQSRELQEFIADHPWVESYCLFKILQERLGGSWTTWPEDLRAPSPHELKALIQRYWPEVTFHIVAQFLCVKQLQKVKEHAHTQGIFLMGDFPFLISKESADIWQYPDLFDTQFSAGAPPDYYNTEGQNWGLPLWRWDPMRKHHFSWWKQRLKCAEMFFDLFRLDHVLGFFRIWAIPPGKLSKEGHYIPKDKNQWEAQGKEILSKIASLTHMLPIAEDLGTVPKMVRPCLRELGICGTKVMRWERNWESKDQHFIPLEDYSPVSISCLSTHDSETLTLWWKKFPDEAKAYADFKHWTYSPHLSNQQREEILWDCHHTSSLFHVNLLQEYLALFPELIWPNPEDERINVPGKILPTNWTYRYKPSVETLVTHKELFSKMQKILFSP